MSASPRVTVVVVNWNGWRDTLDAYRSLVRSDYPNWRLVIVDNASADGSADHLRGLDERVTLIARDRNAGFAGGCNVALRSGVLDDSEYVLLLNNDAAVRPDTLDRLVAAAAETGPAVLGCLVRYKDGGAIQFFGSRRSAAGEPHWFALPADEAQLDAPLIPSDFAFGAALFAPAALFREVGLFDERFFLTWEEVDWCYRARAAGHRCLVVRDAVVDHHGSATLGPARSGLQLYFLERNLLLFPERHSGAVRTARAAAALARSILAEGRSADPSRARARALALRDWLLRRFGDSPAALRRVR